MDEVKKIENNELLVLAYNQVLRLYNFLIFVPNNNL